MDIITHSLIHAIKPHPKFQLIQNLDYTSLIKLIDQFCFLLETRVNHGYLALNNIPFGQIKSIYASILYEKSRYRKIGDSYLSSWDILRDSFGIPQSFSSKSLLIYKKVKEYESYIKTQSFDYLIGYEILGSELSIQTYFFQLLNQLKLNSLLQEKNILIDNCLFVRSDFSIKISYPILVETIMNYLIKDDKFYFVTDEKDADIWIVIEHITTGYNQSLIFWYDLVNSLLDYS